MHFFQVKITLCYSKSTDACRYHRGQQLIFDFKLQLFSLLIPSLSSAQCPPLASPPHTSSLHHRITLSPQSSNNTHQHLPPPPTARALAAIIRGGAGLSPVNSTRPWISRASAGPCRPLSLTLTLPSLPGAVSLPLTPQPSLCTSFSLPWPPGSAACPSILPTFPPPSPFQL